MSHRRREEKITVSRRESSIKCVKVGTSIDLPAVTYLPSFAAHDQQEESLEFTIMVECLRHTDYAVSTINIDALRQFFTEMQQKIRKNKAMKEACETLRKQVCTPLLLHEDTQLGLSVIAGE